MVRRGLLTAIFILLACAAAADDPPDAASTNVKPVQYVVIHAGESDQKPLVDGIVQLRAVVPNKLHAKTVIFYTDGRKFSQDSALPYFTKWDSTSVEAGEHIIKWAALDAEGTELDTGSVVLLTKSPVVNPSNNDVPSEGLGEALAQYSSPLRGVRFTFLAAWTVKDQTASLPNTWEDGYWFVLSTDPVAQATCVINIRHKLLQQEHTPNSFVKYTPYLKTWEKTMIKGRYAFTSSTGSPENKRVTHRIMMLDGKHLFMLNCIDTSGEAPEISKETLMIIAVSIERLEDNQESEEL